MRGGNGSCDLNAYKGLGAFHCLSVVLFNLSTITNFWISCVDELDRATTDNHFRPGIGLVLLVFIVIIKFVNFLVHVLIQSPAARWEEPGKSSKGTEQPPRCP